MTLEQVRAFALSLPRTREEPHFHYTSFRINGRIFATAPPGGELLHVFLDQPSRVAALDAEPDFLQELPWGKRIVGLRVLLPAAKPAAVKVLLEKAWRLKAPKKL